MAKISFRQGIVSHPKSSTSGNQTFLRKNGKDVDIIIDSSTSLEPVVIAFAHQDADYLYSESKTVLSAWENLNNGQDYWLFWEIDLATGHLERDSSTYEPIYSNNEPSKKDRKTGQMWYNLEEDTMRVWQGKTWKEVVRVFAAKLTNGTTFTSVSANADDDDYAGTQVGAYVGQRLRRSVGALVFNKSGKAIKSGNRKQFFTTEDKFLSGVPTGASQKISSNIISGLAQHPLAAYQIVQYNDYNKIGLANSFEQGEKVFGMVESDIETGEVATFITEGVIYNENWNWESTGVEINSPLYVDNSTKYLTHIKPVTDRPAVGVIIGDKEVYFAPRLFPEVTVSTSTGGNGLSTIQLTQLNDATEQTSTNLALLQEHDELISGLGNSVSDIENQIEELKNAESNVLLLTGGELSGELLLAGPPTNDAAATTKSYVDNVLAGHQLNFSSGKWSSGTEKRLTILQIEHGLPIGVFFNVIVADNSGKRVSLEYGVDITTGKITLFTNGAAFAGTVRIT